MVIFYFKLFINDKKNPIHTRWLPICGRYPDTRRVLDCGNQTRLPSGGGSKGSKFKGASVIKNT